MNTSRGIKVFLLICVILCCSVYAQKKIDYDKVDAYQNVMFITAGLVVGTVSGKPGHASF
jgi:hypothetical protein